MEDDSEKEKEYGQSKRNVTKSDGKKIAPVVYSFSHLSLSAYRMPNEIFSPSAAAASERIL